MKTQTEPKTRRKAARLHFPDERNFVTPHVVRHGYSGSYAYELSWGLGIISSGRLYGVTVADVRTGDLSSHGLSQCFHSLAEAEAHIKSLADHD